MGEIDGLRVRLEVVRREYAALTRQGWGQPGPLDERTGERWDRGNVLGHVAELLPFWTGQVRAVLGGAGAMGRDELGSAQRRMGIDSAREVGEDQLLERIDAGIEDLLALLGEMREADLDRSVIFRTGSGDRETDLHQQLGAVLVAHLEEHLRQLRELGP